MFNAFQAFEIRKYKPIVIQLSSFSTSLTKFCKKAHFKGAVFLQSPRSCKKLFKVSIKSLKNMKNLLKISKILVQQQKWNGLHYMHFFRDFSACDFKLSIENQVKRWTNKIIERHRGKCTQTRKLKIVIFSFWSYVWTLYILQFLFIHQWIILDEWKWSKWAMPEEQSWQYWFMDFYLQYENVYSQRQK